MPEDTVILRNVNWNRVKVEARKGNAGNIESNPPVSGSPKTLQRDEDWVIRSNAEDVYYRRDTDPDHPTGEMSVWTHRPCYGNGETYEEEI